MLQQHHQVFLILFLISYLSFCVSRDSFSRPVGVTQNGKLICVGDIQSESVGVTVGNDLVTEHAEFDSMDIDQITATKASTSLLTTPLIIADNELNTLYINAQLKVKGEISYEKKQTQTASSFIEIDNLVINNIKQFHSVKFESDDINVLNIKLNSFLVKDKNNLILEENFALKVLNREKNIKHYKIEMNFSFNSGLWKKGDIAYIKINKDLYWMDNHVWEDNNETDDDKWQTPINIVIPSKFIDNKGTINMVVGIKTTKENKLKKSKFINKHSKLSSIISFDNINLLDK